MTNHSPESHVTKPRYYQHGIIAPREHPFANGPSIPTVMDRETSDVIAHVVTPEAAYLIVTAMNALDDPRTPGEATEQSGGTNHTGAEAQSPTEADRLRQLVHEARNVLWSSENGGHNGRPSEVKRSLESICDEAERLWGTL